MEEMSNHVGPQFWSRLWAKEFGENDLRIRGDGA